MENENLLTAEEKLRIFGEYPLFPLAIFDGETPVQDNMEGIDWVTKSVIAERTQFSPDLIKLILKNPLKITDEDAIELAVSFMGERHRPLIKSLDGRMFASSLNDGETEFTPEEFEMIKTFLKTRGYAVPPTFVKGHWANRKTLFELGLAIEPSIL